LWDILGVARLRASAKTTHRHNKISYEFQVSLTSEFSGSALKELSHVKASLRLE